jgi:hypothetical protein
MKIYLNLESHSPTIFADVDHQDQPFNVDNADDDELYRMLLHLLHLFAELDHEKKEKDWQ